MDVSERTQYLFRDNRAIDGLKRTSIRGLLATIVFRAVAMVRVEIPDGDTFRAILKRIERGNGDVAEIAETHRLVARRVMPGRTHQAEAQLAAAERVARDIDRRARGARAHEQRCSGARANRHRNPVWRIRIARDVFRRMCTEQHFTRRLVRRRAIPNRDAAVAGTARSQ